MRFALFTLNHINPGWGTHLPHRKELVENILEITFISRASYPNNGIFPSSMYS